MRFLDLPLSTMPGYRALVARLRDTSTLTTLLDVGCCFGQDLRQLVADGVPSSRLGGVELRAEFIELGYELFKDRERFEARLIASDIFDDTLAGALETLDGGVDVIHVASFLHLFGWQGQVKTGVKLVSLLRDRAGTVILGRQVGSTQPAERSHPTNPSGVTYLHSPDTFKALWEEVGKLSGTRWKVESFLQSATTHSLNKREKQWMDNQIELLYFKATRVESDI